MSDSSSAQDERRVRFGTAPSGGPFAYRGGEIITTQLSRALEILEDLEGHERGKGPYPTEGISAPDEKDAFEEEPAAAISAEPAPPPTEPPAPPAESSAPPTEPPPPPADWPPPVSMRLPRPDPENGPFFLVRGVDDPLRAVAELRIHGIVAQPNHVYFVHAGDPLTANPVYASPVYASPVYASPVYASPVYASPVYASPVYASPVYASPVYASPVYASPVYASPVYASPVYASPVYASPLAGTDAVVHTSTAAAVVPGDTTHAAWRLVRRPPRGGARIFVLDTGLAHYSWMTQQLATLQQSANPVVRPLRQSDRCDEPTEPGRRYLAPAAGHGTFIVGLVNQVAPGCRVGVGKVLEATGEGDEWTIARRIHALAVGIRNHPDPQRTILSLSFGAPTLDHPYLMAHVIGEIQAAGALVVASAGNDAVSAPQYPAALPGVVAVGALGPWAPAPFTNFGPWVTACAPGVDVVSNFFKWAGPQGAFRGWASWSGTSFAAPMVAASLARMMMTAPQLLGWPLSAAEAKKYVIDSPWLAWIPGLGTVVNTVMSTP